MGGLTTIDAVYFALLLLAPGYVMCAVRNLFLTGREVQGNEQLVKYLSCSGINYLICSPLIYGVMSSGPSLWNKSVLLVATGLVMPIFLGVVAGVSAQNGFSRKILHRFGLHPVHAAPTAWDYLFAKPESQMVKVTLKSGDELLGYWSADSFASSDSKERDLLLKPLYEYSETQGWTPTDRGALVVAGEIRTVEFWCPKPEDYDEREEACSTAEQRLSATESAVPTEGRTGGVPAINGARTAAEPEGPSPEKVAPS